MKRDARIGLAVVLVLGLAVTMLVARALYNRNSESPLDTVDAVAGDGAAPYSGEAYRVDGANVTSATAAAANINAPGTPPLQPAGQPAPAQLNPAVQRFVDDQTRRISPTDGAAPIAPAITGPAQTPAPSTGRPTAGNGASAPAPLPTPAPVLSEDSNADHEGPTAAQPLSGDGFAYTVAAGDNPWKIAAKVYGDGKYTNKIVDANPALKNNKLKVGSVIRIPAIPQKTVLMKLPGWTEGKNGSAIATSTVAKPEAVMDNAIPIAASRPVAAPKGENAFAGATHKVATGETLSDIAKKYYGSSGPKAVNRIVSANNNVNPAKIKVGQELVIPAIK